MLEELQGSTPTIRGPLNASTCPTSPSASETPTFGRCLGCVDRDVLTSAGRPEGLRNVVQKARGSAVLPPAGQR